MPSQKKIGYGVAAGKGDALTLDEIAAFVADAREAGVPGDVCPTAKIRFSGKLSALSVDAQQAGVGQ